MDFDDEKEVQQPVTETGTVAPLMTPNEVAERLSMPVLTLRTWRRNGTGPRVYRIGRRVRYRREDVEKWIEMQATRNDAP